MPYINYCFADKYLKKEYEKVNKISIELKSQLLELMDRYLKYLDYVIKK